MDDIVKISMALFRKERWRIRESIYYNRTAEKTERSHALELASDGLLREHYTELKKVFRSEVESQLRCCSGVASEDDVASHPRHGNNDHCLSNRRSGYCADDTSTIGCNNNDKTDFDDIRDNPEIMLRVYSYLPLRDRICRLSLVDRAYSKDKIRGGIVSATYSGGFNLKQALMELRHWAMEQMEKNRGDGDENGKYHSERIAKISRMLEAANLTDGELLLFTGSNLMNTIVSPPERKRWMTSHVRGFFAREKQQWEEQQQQKQQHQGQSWLTEIVLLKTFLKSYFFDGKVNRLEELIKDAGFEADYEEYIKCQHFSKDHIDGSNNLVWCLPDLYAGCNLLLLDLDGSDENCGDGGWKEYQFVSCGVCNQFHERSQSITMDRDPGRPQYVCDEDYSTLQPWIEFFSKKLICASCRNPSKMLSVARHYRYIIRKNRRKKETARSHMVIRKNGKSDLS